MSHSTDVAIRFLDELVSRPAGPLALLFILQPVMASLLAMRDGYRDASMGRTPFLWTIVHDSWGRATRLREGIFGVLRVVLLGTAMDLAYQTLVLDGFRPLELIVPVVVLCIMPYLVARGPAERVFYRWTVDNTPRQFQPHG